MSLAPNKLAIYYSYPSCVNSTWSVSGASSVFKDYNLLVFGAGLESEQHSDHQNMVDIIEHQDMASTKVFGYVTMTESEATIKAKIDDWHSSSTDLFGIFCDEFGYDYAVSRAKQREIISYIHGKSSPSLKVFANAWNSDDAFSSAYQATYNPDSLAHNFDTSDYYLAESYCVSGGNYVTKSDWVARVAKLDSYKSIVNICCITTPDSSGTFTQSKLNFAYFNTAMRGYHAFGWGEKYYSASDAQLPWRSRPSLPEGTTLDGSIVNSGDVYEINTNVGFNVDWNDHTTDTRLEL